MSVTSAQLNVSSLTISIADHERRFRLTVPNFFLTAGEVVGISGSSGTGKTMFLEVLGLIRKSHSGNYELKQNQTSFDLIKIWNDPTSSPAEIRSQFFGFIPQSGGLLPFLTVSENIALSQKISNRINPAWHQELIERLGLDEVHTLSPSALSIGQRQRVAIARALAHNPAFIIADEPTAALDPASAENAMRLLIESATLGESGVIISSHDLALLDRFQMRRFTFAVETSDNTANPEVHCMLKELKIAQCD
ncbi:MAG: ATP-binding cassette domain-containing protein [Aestuariivita sp.]|nr:ATP-binding cassette domain-containing protein [Aestuariivita sp.]